MEPRAAAPVCGGGTVNWISYTLALTSCGLKQNAFRVRTHAAIFPSAVGAGLTKESSVGVLDIGSFKGCLLYTPIVTSDCQMVCYQTPFSFHIKAQIQ